MWRVTVSTLLVLSLFCGGGDGAVDLTRKVNATGRVVVDAVVDLITQSCVFISDRLMLRRIAYAETTDGAADFTFTQGGGIWQVDEFNFNVTQRTLSATLNGSIKAEFDIDWTQAQYDNLSKPLYSGIAAMLKITTYYTILSIPVTVSDQARYWATSYTVNTWTNATEVYTNASLAVATTCSSPKADVVFVIDSSGSITSNNFLKVKNFVKNVVGSFDISNNTVRVGLVQFSSISVVEFDLLKYSSTNDVTTAVSALQYHNGGTNSAAGLNATMDMIQLQGRHDDGVPVVVIFLTDGRSNIPSDTERAAENFHATLPEVTVFAVGVTSGVNEEELETIASEPKCNNVHLLESFSDITSFSNLILKGACKAQAELDEGREVNETLKKDQQYYLKIRARKDKNGVRVHVEAKTGAVKAFYSWLVQNPSEALHDVMIDVDDDQGSVDVYIPWNEKAERNSEEITDANNQTTMEAPLYGAVVGVEQGQNTFTLYYEDSGVEPRETTSTVSYQDSAVQLTGHHLMALFTASVLLIHNYF